MYTTESTYSQKRISFMTQQDNLPSFKGETPLSPFPLHFLLFLSSHPISNSRLFLAARSSPRRCCSRLASPVRAPRMALFVLEGCAAGRRRPATGHGRRRHRAPQSLPCRSVSAPPFADRAAGAIVGGAGGAATARGASLPTRAGPKALPVCRRLA